MKPKFLCLKVIILCNFLLCSGFVNAVSQGVFTQLTSHCANPKIPAPFLPGLNMKVSNIGTIRYLKISYFSTVSSGVCSGLLGQSSTVDNSAGPLPNINQKKCGFFEIPSSTVYALAQEQEIDTDDIKCIGVYADGSNESSDGMPCQYFKDVSCDSDSMTCSSNQTANTSWQVNPAACSDTYAYITNNADTIVTTCEILSSGDFGSSCVKTNRADFNMSSGIAVSNGFIYVVTTEESNAAITTGLVRCQINTSDATPQHCDDTGYSQTTQTPGLDLDAPKDMFFYNGYMYIVNEGSSVVTKCDISSDGSTLSNCTETSGNYFDAPYGIAIQDGYAYVSNHANDKVTVCEVSASDGTLDCSINKSCSGFDGPQGISISGNYAYINNNANSKVSQCTLSQGDCFSSCEDTGTGFNSPHGNVIENNYTYIVNGNDNVSVCIIDPSTKNLTNCIETGSGFDGPRGITIKNGYAYITNSKSNNVTQCNVNTDGTLTNCTQTAGNVGLTSPNGINTIGDYIYIGSQDNNTLTRCETSSNGALENCVFVQNPFIQPGIAINQSYAYVVNAPNNSISQCLLSKTIDDPTVTCTTYDSQNTQNLSLNDPADVSIYNGYLYVTNPGVNTIVQCTLTSDDAITECFSYGLDADQLSGITFNNGYAYVMDKDNNKVLQCIPSASTGELGSCITTSSGSLNSPLGIAIRQSYAYIVGTNNSNSISFCNVDASDGSLSGCSSTGSNFDVPQFVAIY